MFTFYGVPLHCCHDGLIDGSIHLFYQLCVAADNQLVTELGCACGLIVARGGLILITGAYRRSNPAATTGPRHPKQIASTTLYQLISMNWSRNFGTPGQAYCSACKAHGAALALQFLINAQRCVQRSLITTWGWGNAWLCTQICRWCTYCSTIYRACVFNNWRSPTSIITKWLTD